MCRDFQLGPRKMIIIQRLRRIFAQIQGPANGAYWNTQHFPDELSVISQKVDNAISGNGYRVLVRCRSRGLR